MNIRTALAAATIGVAGLGLSSALPGSAFAADLTLERVMLSTGGVGYFEWEAKVDGNAVLSLDVPLDQVDDVLKSLVVFDDKGGVGGIELPGLEPVGQLFRDLPFGPEALDSPVALLNALQGSEVIATGSRTLTGRLLKVETEAVQLPNGGGVTTRNRITLATEAGLQQLVLEEAQAVKFADPTLQAQLDKALAALATAHSRDRRTLSITSNGQGSRTVRIAYVVATPLWKTSYRLTLPANLDATTSRLQGWAVIENMSGQDWKDVELTLVSGSPVTFRQALYASYYIDRQEVPVEVVGRILPNVDTGASAYAGAPRSRAELDDAERRDYSRGLTAGALGAAPPPPPAPVAAPAPAYESDSYGGGPGYAPQMAGGSTEVASTEALTQVVFKLATPVSVASGRSLSVPIIDRDVPAERLSLYQPGVHQRHPLASVRLKNDGQTGLPPGILTLYERTAGDAVSYAYVGDARLAALPAGEERMIAYALDQKVRIDRAETSDTTLKSGSIDRGVLRTSSTEQRTITYKISGPARETRRLILEIPKLSGYALTEPKTGVEENDLYWRIPAKVDAGKTVEVKVVAERPSTTTLSVENMSDAQIVYYGSSRLLDAKTREAFTKLADLKREQSDQQAKVESLSAKLDDLGTEQERLRANLGSVPRDSDLYRRYLKKLDEQETAIEDLQTRIADAQEASETAAKKLADFIASL